MSQYQIRTWIPLLRDSPGMWVFFSVKREKAIKVFAENSDFLITISLSNPMAYSIDAQTMNSVRSNSQSLKRQRFITWGCKDIGIRKSEFVAKSQILCSHFIRLFPSSSFIFCLNLLHDYLCSARFLFRSNSSSSLSSCSFLSSSSSSYFPSFSSTSYSSNLSLFTNFKKTKTKKPKLNL